eukprot:CAMPEP_0204914758 /NCGR_PEP_ID=MMETSP1397-20131031/12646_1 /ASSEMBLY_ACC=CAM_ASM_000891 /TAXON_ID=49980 /ORGANISM="Climacostomum Climacostomum virens, Strain Stock W-24" /LENGTH=73 /DNA_ID=CAMNT_0052086467 /DNA_START=104 /DNA_END=325 /DNA_ORIENTATION=-
MGCSIEFQNVLLSLSESSEDEVVVVGDEHQKVQEGFFKGTLHTHGRLCIVEQLSADICDKFAECFMIDLEVMS